MAKKNKKKSNGDGSTSTDAPQPMDTSEAKPSNPALGSTSRKIKKGIPLKRSKNLRKMKGIAKAISNGEKIEEKMLKNKTKTNRVLSAKTLYD